MAGLAATCLRFGYRRINVFMERLGHVMGVDKPFRLWFKAGLQVSRKRGLANEWRRPV
jgi:putative transposase